MSGTSCDTPGHKKKPRESDTPAGLTPCSQRVLLGNRVGPRAALLVPVPVGERVRRELAMAGWVPPDSPRGPRVLRGDRRADSALSPAGEEKGADIPHTRGHPRCHTEPSKQSLAHKSHKHEKMTKD